MESSSAERVELPAAFEEASEEHLADLIADMFDRLMVHNDNIPLTPESLTRFHSRSAPNITILDYLKRIVQFTRAEKTCLLITLHYIDQICARVPLFTLSSLTCHRFVIASITVSSKALCDTFCSNSTYAKVGGIPIAELNILEREFLSLIDWRLTCTREVLQEYYVSLVRTHRSNRYVISGPELSSSASSSESDAEMDGAQSKSSPPLSSSSRPQSSLEEPLQSSSSPSSSTTMATTTMASTSQSYPYTITSLASQNLGVNPGMVPTAPHYRRATASTHEPSAILIDPGSQTQPNDPPRRPTLEQNMAFAELRQHRR